MVHSPGFRTVLIRLLVLSIASGGLYLLLAVASCVPPGTGPLALVPHPVRFEEMGLYLAIWSALFVLYGLGAKTAAGAKGRALLVLVFLSSTAFRGILAWKSDFSIDAPPAFLQAESPLKRAASELVPLERRIAAGAFDLASLALLPGMLRAASLPPGLAILYGWNPLLVKESAGSARIEGVALFFLLLAMRFARSGRPGLSALVYGASLSGPPFFWATLPLFALALRLRLGLSLAVAAVSWGALAASQSIPDLLGWPPESFTGGSIVPSLATAARLVLTRDPLVPLALCGGLWCALAAARVWKGAGSPERLPREALLVLGWLLLLLPEVMPWSFVPIAGLSAFGRNRGWLVFSATSTLTYLALGEASYSFWLGFAQYFPPLFVSIFIALGRRKG